LLVIHYVTHTDYTYLRFWDHFLLSW